MKFKLLISSFLGVVAAVAMDSLEEGHNTHRLRGDVALAIVEARKKEKNTREGEHHSRLSRYFGAVIRKGK